MTVLRIAAAQSVSIPGDIAANVAAHCRFIAEASSHHIDVLVFPELSLCGYELPLMAECVLRPDDEGLRPIRELVVQTGVSVIVGAPIASTTDRPYIGALMFRAGGETSIYCKHHLHPGEERFASACPRACQTHRIGDDAMAVAICADTAHEAHPKAAAEAGATLYLASVLVSETGYATDAGNLQGYARQYGMATLMANHGGPSGGYVSAGKSAFWSPNGQLIVAAPGAGECLVIASRGAEGWSGELRTIST